MITENNVYDSNGILVTKRIENTETNTLATTYGAKGVWGVINIDDIPSLHQAIEGKVRFRMRNTSFVQAFIKNVDGIIHGIVTSNEDGSWNVPGILQGKNITVEGSK